jgi:hypothetical protein
MICTYSFFASFQFPFLISTHPNLVHSFGIHHLGTLFECQLVLHILICFLNVRNEPSIKCIILTMVSKCNRTCQYCICWIPIFLWHSALTPTMYQWMNRIYIIFLILLNAFSEMKFILICHCCSGEEV